MIKNKYRLLFFLWLFSFTAFSCGGNDNKKTNGEGSSETKTYSNPVVSTSLPDPTVIRAGNGYFYLYATEDIRNVPILKSKDMVNWSQVGTVFTDETRPAFIGSGGIWAPDIEYINGQYVLYYAVSWGAIGAAVSASPEGPFTDKGKIFTESEIGVKGSIDPCYMEDNGRKYLIWGSFYGIYAVELTDNGLQLKTGAKPVQIAGTSFEGSYVFKRGDYYYYFGSTGTCCDGVNSTYKVVYGRSKSLFGPYLDKEGESLTDNKYDILIYSNTYFVGNGHDSQIVQDDAGNDWIFYHGYVKSSGQGRYLMLSQVKWTADGWPYVGSPQIQAIAPVIK